jgi:hypothetical protein
MNETTSHLLLQCSYTEVAWDILADHFHLPDYNSLGTSGGPLH